LPAVFAVVNATCTGYHLSEYEMDDERTLVRIRVAMAVWPPSPAPSVLLASRAVGRAVGRTRRKVDVVDRVADGVFAAFARATSDRLGPDGIAAVHAVLNRHLPRPNTDNTPSCAARFAAIVGVAGLKPRPPPSNCPC
jgi:hypothetical protein